MYSNSPTANVPCFLFICACQQVVTVFWTHRWAFVCVPQGVNPSLCSTCVGAIQSPSPQWSSPAWVS